LRKVEVVSKPESRVGTEPVIESGAGGAVRSVKENIFIVRDKLEREKGGKPVKKLDPLSGFEEKSHQVELTQLCFTRRRYEGYVRHLKIVLV